MVALAAIWMEPERARLHRAPIDHSAMGRRRSQGAADEKPAFRIALDD